MRSEVFKLYPDRDDVTLTSYVIADSPETTKGAKRPGVLVCPGGAYLFCSDREAEPVAIRFAAMGYHAFVLRYSVYYEGRPPVNTNESTLEMVPNPHSIHPAPMRDIAKAFLFLHDHADAWALDSSRIAICGFSAGAHNCAMYSMYWHAPVITEFFGQPEEKFRPAAGILAYTLSDYILLADTAKNLKDPMGRALFNASVVAFTGTSNPGADLLEAVSPARQVNAKTPPMFIWSTAGDSLVPVQHSTVLATALAAQKIPFELHVFEEGEHGLSLGTQASAESRSQINADVAKWSALAEAWLEKRLALDLPELSHWELEAKADG
ncbi:MAG: alpha/beta hydrolase [Saccharofermentanales bacterium]